jgi:hypothetical protein
MARLSLGTELLIRFIGFIAHYFCKRSRQRQPNREAAWLQVEKVVLKSPPMSSISRSESISRLDQ